MHGYGHDCACAKMSIYISYMQRHKIKNGKRKCLSILWAKTIITGNDYKVKCSVNLWEINNSEIYDIDSFKNAPETQSEP